MYLHLLQNIILHSKPHVFLKILKKNNILNNILSKNYYNNYKKQFELNNKFESICNSGNDIFILKNYQSIINNYVKKHLIIYINKNYDIETNKINKYATILSIIRFKSNLLNNKVNITVIKFILGAWEIVKYVTKSHNYIEYFNNYYINRRYSFEKYCKNTKRIKYKLIWNDYDFFYKYLHSIDDQYKYLPFIIDKKNKNILKNPKLYLKRCKS